MKKQIAIVLAAGALAAAMAGCGATPPASAGASAPLPAASPVAGSIQSASVAAPAQSSTAPAAAAPAAGTAQAAAPAPAAGTAAAPATAVTQEQAQAVALAHAGFAQADVTFINTHLDWDDGRQVYEVEFVAGNAEYDYDVDAASGEIVSYDMDIENYSIPAQQAAGAAAAVTEADARATALARVPGATEANLRMHLDWDDGLQVYEGTIVYNEMEYDFEIDANTGAITEWDVDSIYD